MSNGDNHPRAIEHWVPVAGRWEFAGNTARFLGPLRAEDPPAGIALSGIRLRDGKVSAKVKFAGSAPGPGTAGVILGYHGQDSGYVVVGLGAHDAAYGISEYDPTLGWRLLVGRGSVQNLSVGQWYSIEVIQRGQEITMSDSDVTVFRHVLTRPLVGNQLGVFGWGKGPVEFSEVVGVETRPRLFVAMQFSEPFDTLYQRVIQPKATAAGFEVVRIDEVMRPGIIFEDIKREISQSKAVIAEISAPNNNVFYELGYAHALNKPTILLAQRGKELPFDIRSYRVVFYDDTIGGKVQLEETLDKHLHAVLHDV